MLRPGTLVLCSLLLCGCSTEAWYEGVRRGSESQCRQANPADPEQCLSRLNTKRYDEYDKVRSAR